MEVGADAATAEPKVADRDTVDQAPHRLDERLQRLAVVFVVVLEVLIANRRTQPYLAASRAHEVHAKAMPRGMGQRIHERVHQRPPGWRELRIFAPAGI